MIVYDYLWGPADDEAEAAREERRIHKAAAKDLGVGCRLRLVGLPVLVLAALVRRAVSR